MTAPQFTVSQHMVAITDSWYNITRRQARHRHLYSLQHHRWQWRRWRCDATQTGKLQQQSFETASAAALVHALLTTIWKKDIRRPNDCNDFDITFITTIHITQRKQTHAYTVDSPPLAQLLQPVPRRGSNANHSAASQAARRRGCSRQNCCTQWRHWCDC